MSTLGNEITGLLLAWQGGDQAAYDDVVTRLYRELHSLAASCVRREQWHASLSSTELLSEAYLRLSRQKMPEWENRGQFFAVSTRLMRQILVDRARARHAEKRPLPESNAITRIPGPPDPRIEFLDLHRVIDELAAIDERKARLIEFRYFGGLTIEEITAVEDISERTIRREVRFAEAWLMTALGPHVP